MSVLFNDLNDVSNEATAVEQSTLSLITIFDLKACNIFLA